MPVKQMLIVVLAAVFLVAPVSAAWEIVGTMKDEMTDEIEACYAFSSPVEPTKPMGRDYRHAESGIAYVIEAAASDSNNDGVAYLFFAYNPLVLNREYGFFSTNVKFDEEIITAEFWQFPALCFSCDDGIRKRIEKHIYRHRLLHQFATEWRQTSPFFWQKHGNGGDGGILQFADNKKMIERIKNHNSMLLRLDWMQSGITHFRYDLTGAKAAIEKARKDCGR